MPCEKCGGDNVTATHDLEPVVARGCVIVDYTYRGIRLWCLDCGDSVGSQIEIDPNWINVGQSWTGSAFIRTSIKIEEIGNERN